MNELKPYPAPYRATKAGATVFDADDHPVAHVFAGAGRIATARLFAKSPELLVLLKEIAPKECPVVTHHKPDCVFCRALRLIAEVEGDPQ